MSETEQAISEAQRPLTEAQRPPTEAPYAPSEAPRAPSQAAHDPSEAAREHPPMSERSRWIALYVLCVGMLMIVLDATVVNVALPSIQTDLHFTQSSLAWVINAYLIAFGGLLLLAGRFGDLIGRKTIFMIGLAVFTLASLACGLAQSQEMLVAARFVQGVGGALTSAVILGMIVTMFPQPREQAKAIGVYGFVASAGGSVGLLAGGIITQSIDWHWIFFVNVPIGIVTAFLAIRLLDSDEGIGLRAGADVPGALLITSALMLGVYTIVKPAAEHGWGSAEALGLGAISVALLVAFIVREAKAANPLMPLRIFRSRNVAGANTVQALLVAGMFGMFFLGALYLQRVLGYDALQIGLAFLPATIVMGILSLRFSERLIMTFGPKRTLLPGLVLLQIGLLLFARVPVKGNYITDILPIDDPAGIGRRRQLPGADDAGDVGRDARGRGVGVGPGEHGGTGGRGAGVGGAGDAERDAHGEPAGEQQARGGGADERLPPGLPDRRGADADRDRGRGAGTAGTGAAGDGRAAWLGRR